jgi:hypothetical protein
MQAVLIFGLTRLAQRFGHHFALAEKEAPTTSPLRSHFLQSLISHVSYTEQPDMVVLVDG